MRDEAIRIGKGIQSMAADAVAEAAKIRSAINLSDIGKTEKLESLHNSTVHGIEVGHKSIAADVRDAITEAQKAAEKVTAVSDEAMAARAAILSPIIQNAITNPDGLIVAYEKRYQNMADRRLLEEVITSTLDTLETTKGEAGRAALLSQRYTEARTRLRGYRPAEEIEAEAKLKATEEIGGYIDRARNVALFDMAEGVSGRRLSGDEMIARATWKHEVGVFERTPAGVQ